MEKYLEIISNKTSLDAKKNSPLSLIRDLSYYEKLYNHKNKGGSNLSENLKINTSRAYIDPILKKFKLIDISENYEEIIEYAVQNKLSYREFLSELYNMNFVNKNENIIFIGPPGVGKSHLATALGVKACELGFKVLFITAKDLIENLYRNYEKGTLRNSFNKLKKIDLLIIDELGHFMMDKEKESIFFQLIRHRYEKNSLIITTNIPLGDWNKIFSSQLAATAILDRLLHHGNIISITGDSYRVKEFLARGENCV
ncbi:IS21-like element helper ATPase IstB [Clostridium cochlearium]|uniref:IS21-like element helper ATPase IstB n=1 Tax=Clostridium cochlearium TaxID=1494 RepID=UPI001FA8CB3C|nr:IS21-like element helper ATPase IstB [Clostridium cochlearium]